MTNYESINKAAIDAANREATASADAFRQGRDSASLEILDDYNEYFSIFGGGELFSPDRAFGYILDWHEDPTDDVITTFVSLWEQWDWMRTDWPFAGRRRVLRSTTPCPMR